MLAQLPVEIIDQVIERLSLEDIRAIACVCSALRPPALLRLFRTIRIRSLAETADTTPSHTEAILSHPNLLQCASRLIVEEPQFPFQALLDQREISIHSLWSYLPMMHRLTYLELDLGPSNEAIGLSTLEGLGLTKEIELNLRLPLTPDLVISNKPLPVRSLSISVDTAGDQSTRRLLQKCSQSLRELRLFIQMDGVPSIPPLPHLFELVLHMSLAGDDPDLALWFPFLEQHPTITRLSVDTGYTLAVPTPPNVLPNLRSIGASRMVTERLIPGRPVHDVRVEWYCFTSPQIFVDIMSRVLRLSDVPLTILQITTYHTVRSEELVKIVQTLPKLRKFTLDQPRCAVCQFSRVGVFKSDQKQYPFDLHGILSALGRCKDMFHIRLFLWVSVDPLNERKALWSRSDFVQMIHMVQENGAADLGSFELQVDLADRNEGFQAMRVGWLDVPWQPEFRGEWRLDLLGATSEDSGTTMPTPSAAGIHT